MKLFHFLYKCSKTAVLVLMLHTEIELKRSQWRFWDYTQSRRFLFWKMNNGGRVKVVLFSMTRRFFNDTAVHGGIAVLLCNRYFLINNCTLKKARPPPGNILLMNMNCLIIYILLIIPYCPIASCSRAFFVFSYPAQKVKKTCCFYLATLKKRWCGYWKGKS